MDAKETVVVKCLLMLLVKILIKKVKSLSMNNMRAYNNLYIYRHINLYVYMYNILKVCALISRI